jgi:mRNA interferase HigB
MVNFPNWDIDALMESQHHIPKLGRKNMRLIGREKLASLKGIGSEIEKWVRTWASEVMNAHWKHPTEVSIQFPNAKNTGNGTFIFPACNGGLTIQLLIVFPQGVALITDLKVSEDTHGH